MATPPLSPNESFHVGRFGKEGRGVEGKDWGKTGSGTLVGLGLLLTCIVNITKKKMALCYKKI